MKTLLSALLLTIVAATAEAQSPGQLAVLSCRNAAVKEVRTQRSEADSVRVSPNPVVTATSSAETEVQGSGQYLDRSQRQWRSFTYSCTYRTRSAKTRITVRIDASGGAPR